MQTSIKEPLPASRIVHPAASPNRIKHIDGLRALAIVGVVMFHCFKLFPNGYLGVDIFLVISGYLLFMNFWGSNTPFSFASFARKKFCRLWPVTIVISVMSVGLTLFLLSLNEFPQTVFDAIATLIGCANIYFDYKIDGYFTNIGSVQMPLSHSWYLSMIAQVYLLSGILLYLCQRLSNRAKFLILSICIIVSCIICYMPSLLTFITPLHEEFSTYYWTSGRLWMVFAGALIPLLPSLPAAPNVRKAIGGISFVMLLLITLSPEKFNIVWIPETISIALSMACIKFGGEGFCQLALGNRVCLGIGKYSFSLYLVHWPILVTIAAYSLSWNESVWPKLIAIACSAVAAFLFYHIVEKRRFSAKCVSVVLLSSLALLYATTYNFHRIRYHFHKDVDDVLNKTYNEISFEKRELNTGKLYQTLPDFRRLTYRGNIMNYFFSLEHFPLLYSIGDNEREGDFLLIGDCHAELLVEAMDKLAKRHNWCGAYLNTYVIPIENKFSAFVYCQRWDREKGDLLIDYLRKNPQIKTILIANWWRARNTAKPYYDWDGNLIDPAETPDHFYQNLKTYFKRIKACGVKIIVFTDAPSFKKIGNPVQYVKKHVRLKAPLNEEDLSCTLEEYNRQNKSINDFLEQMAEEKICSVVHLEQGFFKNGAARCYSENVFYTRDQHHLTPRGALKALEGVEEELDSLLRNPYPAEQGLP
ncbi:MAG: acyltransferase [Akkermansia sp.]|nr:acyltransferase [Akkermansia sp.]